MSVPSSTPISRLSPNGVITVLGSLNMDLVVRTARLPSAGQTVLGSSFVTVCGGKGANQAVAAARAAPGRSVEMLGAIGDDGFGAELRAHLAGNHVHVGHLRTVAGSSGVASILVEDSAQNLIVVVPGANATMTRLHAAEEELVGGSGIVIAQLEIPIATVAHAASICASTGRPFLLNPSPVQPLPAELIAGTTLLVLNEGEAAELGTAVDAVPHVVITLGARGAHYRGPHGEVIDVPAPEVRAVDTTGAGDAFTGALAVAWSEGRPVADALRFACIAGSLACTRHGADSAPTRAEIAAVAR